MLLAAGVLQRDAAAGVLQDSKEADAGVLQGRKEAAAGVAGRRCGEAAEVGTGDKVPAAPWSGVRRGVRGK